MQDRDLSLVIGKIAQRKSQVLFSGIVPVRRTKPRRVGLERGVSILKFSLVQHGIAYTRKDISLLVERSAQAIVLDQFQENLVDRILSASPLTPNR